MALTIQTQPQQLSPGYNPVVYAFSGTNNTHSGYRYLVDIYSGNTTGSTVAQLKVTPTPNGDGYVDVSRILNNLVTVDFDSTSVTDSNASNSYFNYSAQIGEEFLYEWPYQKVTSATTGTVRYVVLSGATTGATPTYTAGDQIEVLTITTGATSVVNGLHTVVTATSNTITIDILYPSTAASGATILNITGNTTFADRRNIQTTGLTAVTGTTIINAALDWPDWKVWVGTDYTVQFSSPSITKRLLTSLDRFNTISADNKFFMTPSQNIWVNFYTDSPTSAHTVNFVLYNQSGSISTSGSFIIINSFNGNVKQFRIGFTALGLTPTTGQYLKFYLKNATSQISKEYTIYADTRCVREDVQLYYLDRMGSIMSQSFQLNTVESITVNRDTIKKPIIYGANANLDLSEAGSVNTNIDLDRSYVLTTDWLSQTNIDMMEELISSRYVWMKISGGYVPVIIKDNTYEMVKQRNKRLLRKTVTVELANQRPIN